MCGDDERGDRGPDPAVAFERVHHKEAGAGEGEGDAKVEGQRLGDREAALGEDVRQPAADPGGGAKKRDEADHRGDDPAAIAAEDDADRVAVDIGEPVGDEFLAGGGAAEPHPLQEIERPLALPVGDQPARRFGKREAEEKQHHPADADDDPHPPPADRAAQAQRQQGPQRPHAGAADKLHKGGDPAADRFGRIFGGVRKAQWLRRTKPDPGDEPAKRQPPHGRRQSGRDRGDAVEKDRELKDRLAAETVGELALADRAEKQADQGGAADRADLPRRGKVRSHHVRHQRAQNDIVDDVKEIAGGDQRQHPAMDRPQGRVVEPRIDPGYDRLCHPASP